MTEGLCASGSPPYSNRGVSFQKVPALQSVSHFQFDGYCATLDQEVVHVLDYLQQALLDAEIEYVLEDGPPVRFYDRNRLFLDPDGKRLLSVRSGGANALPFVECYGPTAPIVAAELRQQFPTHRPSRVDSAMDLHGEGVFERLADLARSFERQSGIRLDYQGAAIGNPDRGTTVYLGSRSSLCYVRIYQKGLKTAEELGLSGDQIPDVLRYWVRVELEFKPKKRWQKQKAAKLSPEALWGCSPWVSKFAKEALQVDAERVVMYESRETNIERSFRHSADQYGPTHLAMIERVGIEAYFELWLSMIGHDAGRQDAA